MAKRKRDPNRDRKPPDIRFHHVHKRPGGVTILPPDLPAEVLPLPFQGEKMVCLICGKEQISSTEHESGWTVLSHDGGQRHYFCPDEFPSEGKSDDYEAAYMLAICFMMATEAGDLVKLSQLRELRSQITWR